MKIIRFLLISTSPETIMNGLDEKNKKEAYILARPCTCIELGMGTWCFGAGQSPSRIMRR